MTSNPQVDQADEQPARRQLIESRSIDYVPQNERHGNVWHQGPFWFTGNFVLTTMVVGFVGPSIGLDLLWSVIAVVLGAVFGTFFMAFHANQGPRMGLPQMIQSRAQFGIRGAVLPFIAVLFVYIGFNVFNVILATQGLHLVLPGASWLWYTVLILIAVAFAVVGYDLLHFIQRWLTYVLIVVFAILTVGAIAHLDAGSAIPATSGFSWGPFLITFGAAAGYQISYAVYVSDYSRYLPQGRPGARRHLMDLPRRRRLRGLADGARRVPRLVDQRTRRDRKPPAGRQLGVPRIRHLRRPRLHPCTGQHHGDQLLRGHAHRRQRGRWLPPCQGDRP